MYFLRISGRSAVTGLFVSVDLKTPRERSERGREREVGEFPAGEENRQGTTPQVANSIPKTFLSRLSSRLHRPSLFIVGGGERRHRRRQRKKKKISDEIDRIDPKIRLLRTLVEELEISRRDSSFSKFEACSFRRPERKRIERRRSLGRGKRGKRLKRETACIAPFHEFLAIAFSSFLDR